MLHYDKTNKIPLNGSYNQQSHYPLINDSETQISNSVLNPHASNFESTNINNLPISQTFAGTSCKPEQLVMPYKNHFSFQGHDVYTFLSTAVIYIYSQSGEKIKIRILLDVGSQMSFLRKEIAELLKVKQMSINAPISGLNNSLFSVKQKLITSIESCNGQYRKKVDFLIVNNITDLTLSKPLNISNISLPGNINYADPNFFNPGKIDALLGADMFYELLKPNQIKLKNEQIMLQETVFGWVISGSIKLSDQKKYHCGLINTLEDVNDSLTKFWELESLGIKDAELRNEEDKALEIFSETVCFKNGRYEASLPWKRQWEELSDNFKIAEKRLESLANRLKRDNSLYVEYCEILENYLNDGIIEKVLTSVKIGRAHV